MGTLFEFLLKASAGIILFYLVYRFFLMKETFYEANRWFLIMALLSSVFLALFPVNYPVSVVAQTDTNVFEALSHSFIDVKPVPETTTDQAEVSRQQIVFFIYIAGSLILLLRLIIQTVTLIVLILKCRNEQIEGLRIVKNNRYNMPFSFFNVVFIHFEIDRQSGLQEIIAHEKVHISGRHWIDLLIIELLTVIFWFNPFIWFFERAIKQNHEFLADQGVLAQGHKKGMYQFFLIKHLTGIQIEGLTNNLNFALNKNRFKMMTKMKTPKMKKLKLAWAFPVLTILLFAFAQPDYKIQVIEPEMSAYPSEEQDENRQQIIYGKVVKEKDKEPLPGASVVIRGTTVGAVSDREGNFKLINTAPTVDTSTGGLITELVISYVGYETEVAGIGPVVNKNDTGAPVVYHFQLKEGVVYIDSESFSKAKQPPHPANQHVAGSSGEEIFFIVEEMPEYSGGFYALEQYVTENQNRVTRDKSITGKAMIGFTIDQEGKVTDIKILESDNQLAGNEAAKIIMNMPDWKPGKQRGVPVPVKFVIQMRF